MTYIQEREKNPYRIDHLIKEDGKTLSIGAVENLFDAQWMVNHSQKQIKDQLDLASKMLFQTSDGNFVGQNAMTNIQTGDILIHQTNEPLTQLNNTPDIASMQSNQQQWQQLGMTINGISEAMQTGEAKSGAAWRQVEALLQESHSLFELMTENKGLSIEEMLREFIIPHIKKNIDTTEEISEILQDHQIKFIDSNYVPNEALRRVEQIKKEIVLQGQVFDPTTEEQEVREQENIIQGGLNKQGRQRFIQPSDIKEKTWKESLKDLEWDLDVDITGEVKDKRGALATLNTLLQALVNPKIQQLLQTDEGKMIVNKILDLSGTVSPVEMSQISTQPQVQAEEVPQLV
jgi:DNA-binding transcriptional MerR regulator